MTRGEMVTWAAGLFEGEGSFVPRGDGAGLTIVVSSTDEDVLRRLTAIFGVGRIYKIRKQHDRKQAWVWSVNRADDVALVLEELEPFLGQRRLERLNELRALRQSVIRERTKERACAYCGHSFCPTNHSWSRRTKYCSPKCRNAGNWKQWNERQALSAHGAK